MFTMLARKSIYSPKLNEFLDMRAHFFGEVHRHQSRFREREEDVNYLMGQVQQLTKQLQMTKSSNHSRHQRIDVNATKHFELLHEVLQRGAA